MKRMLIAVVLCLGASIALARDARIVRAEAAVREKMSDPDSAQFRHTEIREGTKGWMVIGEVNGKNTLGGYTGHHRFMYVNGEATIFP